MVYSPQIIENYQLQSGEGLSVGFVVTWLIGDLCNTSGAILAGLQPTIIILGVYVSQSIVLVRCRGPAETTPSTLCVTQPFSLKSTTTDGSGHAEMHRSSLPKTPGSLRSTMKQVRSYRETVAPKNHPQCGPCGRMV